jgi:radical SAM protein with 4Fe4S-binding SPASM domain
MTHSAVGAPLYVAWELTHRCNARCLHCYSDSSPEADSSKDLTTAEALRVIDELADAGVLVLAFSGGEPLLRRDWEVLVGHAVARGLTVNVGTNGSSITTRRADALRRLGVHSVTVSIDSDHAEVHDHFRQTRGLFVRAVRAVQRLVERNVRVVVGFTPTRLNWQDGPGVVALAQQLGAAAVNLSEYVPAGRGPIRLALEPHELRSVLETWIALRDRLSGQIELQWHDCRVGLLVPPHEQRSYQGCGAGRMVARICPDGTVTPCVFLPTAIGSLRENSFRGLWTTSELLDQFRGRHGHVTGNCGSCEHLDVCGGCRAVAYAYSHGDPLAGDPHCWINAVPVTIVRGLQAGEALPV